ncbi:4Fe-4S dicluster domain-containing protein [Sulfolobus sp. E5-1-F]|uniref:4Fe-4S dicluster domain-containing protein n=1 Tax=Sulfolobaceae TaxID=118883 RepID=UPI00129645CF|nr:MULTISPECIES: 4Fe-4S dicluster domain-containing protein [unclassified Sulfolobus]QGA55143.1 4Fe-4S dicluster domain-containing protein [Sulfolobus sp. E5-1-F]QGA67946.1 4Fe-4S dicluster domain-containing protein [Sulfolobus sp. E11-6]
MHEKFYRILKPTKIGNVEVKNVIKYSEGVSILPNAVPRYEYFRGIEGENVIDFIDYRGIDDLGDKLRVKAGTKWKEVLEKYKVEFWSNIDFAVGGSVYFNDPITGFNEFAKINGRVEVDAYLDGKYYSGRYKGGIIINVYLKKEDKEIVYKRLDGELSKLIPIIKSWYASRIPVFREVSLVKKGMESYILVSYPKIREVLVQKLLLDGFYDEISPIIEQLEYKYWYLGYSSLNDLENIINLVKESQMSIIRFRKDEIAFSIYSDRRLESIGNTLEYSTTEGEGLFNGCILCGKCVSVCPYGEQTNDVFHTPLGFYSISYFEKDNDLANCHICGLCEEVCPVRLDITKELRKAAKLNQIPPKNLFKGIKSDLNSVLVITSLSEELKDQIIKSFIYLIKKGKRVSLFYMAQDFSKLVKDEPSLEELFKFQEIYTITPEEYFYLQRLKKRSVVDIYNLQLLAMNDLKINKNDLHIPCLLRSELNDSNFTCSNVFLNILNNKDNINRNIKKKITLCPLTARELHIKTPIDLLGINLDENYINEFLKKLEIASKDLREDIEEDLGWYKDIDNKIIDRVYSTLIDGIIKGENIENLVLLYFKLDSMNLDENIKEILTNKLTKIIFS